MDLGLDEVVQIAGLHLPRFVHFEVLQRRSGQVFLCVVNWVFEFAYVASLVRSVSRLKGIVRR